MQCSSDKVNGRMFLNKNGATVSTGSASKDGYQGIFGTAILNLVAGDQVSPTDKRIAEFESFPSLIIITPFLILIVCFLFF